jgi:hypothetical protein
MKAAIAGVPLRDWLLKKPEWLDDEMTVEATFAVIKRPRLLDVLSQVPAGSLPCPRDIK